MASDSDLAQRYDYEAILERHHCAVARELLATDDDDNNNNNTDDNTVASSSTDSLTSSSSSSSSSSNSLLRALPAGEQEVFLGLVEQAILATDMAHHFQLVDTLQQQQQTQTQTQLPQLQTQLQQPQHSHHSQPPDTGTTTLLRTPDHDQANDPPSTLTPTPTPTTPSSHMNTLMGVILHAADIGAQTQRLEVAQRWGDRVVKEFQDQALHERELGLPPTPYMQVT